MVGGMTMNSPGHYNDTTFTKIFVGGLAWETQRDTMKRYFEQFGEILEAVVISDKQTGRSKGYGFVTFKDPEAAMRACQNPSPVIDGRRTNCNLASLGANKNRSPTPQYGNFAGAERSSPGDGQMATPAYHGPSSAFFYQPSGQFTFPYSSYGYSGYSQDNMCPMNYCGVYGGQQFSPYYPSPSGPSGPTGLVHNIYPFYTQYAQSRQAQDFGVQYPQMVQFPFLPQHYGSTGILSFPSSVPIPTATTTSAVSTTTITMTSTAARGGASQASGASSGQNSST